MAEKYRQSTKTLAGAALEMKFRLLMTVHLLVIKLVGSSESCVGLIGSNLGVVGTIGARGGLSV